MKNFYSDLESVIFYIDSIIFVIRSKVGVDEIVFEIDVKFDFPFTIQVTV